MIFFAFLIASASLFIQNALFAQMTLLSYVPFLALITLIRSPPKSLYLALLAGIVLDLLSNDPLGIHAINYCLIVWIMARFKQSFLYNNPIHFTLLTYMISFSSTLLQVFLLFLFDRRVPFSGKWVLGDLFLMPGLDAIYALLCFSIPLMLYIKLRYRWSNYWHQIKERLFQYSPK